MRQYIIYKKAPELDWSAVPTLPIDCLLWSEPVSITASAALCYDSDALYVRLCAAEQKIRAEHTGLLDQPCEDSCLEFFFSPVDGDDRYFNIELNPNCCLFLGFGSSRYDLIRLIADHKLLSPTAQRTDDGWQVTYRIPFAFIRQFFPEFHAEPGATMRANFYKCGELTEQSHFLSWNPILLSQPEFHCPAYFGLLRFG